MMHIPSKIIEIEDALEARRIALGKLYSAANINQSSWSRWRRGVTSPREVKWRSVERAVAELTGGPAE